MTTIEIEIQKQRNWFINHSEFNQQNARDLPYHFNLVLELLKQGKQLNLSHDGFSYSGLYDIFSSSSPRIRKIANPDKILLTPEEENDFELIYEKVCSTVIVQLAPGINESYTEAEFI